MLVSHMDKKIVKRSEYNNNNNTVKSKCYQPLPAFLASFKP